MKSVKMSQLLVTPMTITAPRARKATGPITLPARDATRGQIRAIVMPAANGTPMTRPISSSMSTASSSMSSSSFLPVGWIEPQNATLSGIRTIASRLLTAVIDTDSATSPFARWVRMFDTLPGGQQATRIMPSATEPRTSSASVSRNVSAGSSRNWATTPIPITTGRRAAALKSSILVSSAMPKRIAPMTILSVVSEPSSKAIWMPSTSPASTVTSGLTTAPRSRRAPRSGRRPC